MFSALNVTLHRSTSVTACLSGRFILDADGEQLVLLRGSSFLELLTVGQGHPRVVASQPTFAHVRSLTKLSLPSSLDALVLGSDSGRIAVVGFDQSTNRFVPLAISEELGRAGTVRNVAGQFVATSPVGNVILASGPEMHSLRFFLVGASDVNIAPPSVPLGGVPPPRLPTIQLSPAYRVSDAEPDAFDLDIPESTASMRVLLAVASLPVPPGSPSLFVTLHVESSLTSATSTEDQDDDAMDEDAPAPSSSSTSQSPSASAPSPFSYYVSVFEVQEPLSDPSQMDVDESDDDEDEDSMPTIRNIGKVTLPDYANSPHGLSALPLSLGGDLVVYCEGPLCCVVEMQGFRSGRNACRISPKRPFPRRSKNGANSVSLSRSRRTMIVCSELQLYSNEARIQPMDYEFIAISEFGDVYRLQIELEEEEEGVSTVDDIPAKYLDTLGTGGGSAPSGVCILETGQLFVAFEFGSHYIFDLAPKGIESETRGLAVDNVVYRPSEMEEEGEDAMAVDGENDEGVVWMEYDGGEVDGADTDGALLVRPRRKRPVRSDDDTGDDDAPPYTSTMMFLRPAFEMRSLAPITSLSVSPVTRRNAARDGKTTSDRHLSDAESNAARSVVVSCGTGDSRSAALRLLRSGLNVKSLAPPQDLTTAFGPDVVGIWAVENYAGRRSSRSGGSGNAPHTRFIIVSFATSTCVLQIDGKSFAVALETNVESQASTLAYGRTSQSDVCVISTNSVQLLDNSLNQRDHFELPANAPARLATCNQSFAVVVTAHELRAFELMVGGICAMTDSSPIQDEVSCLALSPPSIGMNSILAVAYHNHALQFQSVHFEERGRRMMPTKPVSLLFVDHTTSGVGVVTEGEETNAEEIFLYIGMMDGSLTVIKVDRETGRVTDDDVFTRSIGDRPVFLSRIEKDAILATSNKNLLIRYDAVSKSFHKSPISYEPLRVATAFSSSYVPTGGVVGMVTNQRQAVFHVLRVSAPEQASGSGAPAAPVTPKLHDVPIQVGCTPRKFVLDSLSGFAFVIESDQNLRIQEETPSPPPAAEAPEEGSVFQFSTSRLDVHSRVWTSRVRWFRMPTVDSPPKGNTTHESLAPMFSPPIDLDGEKFELDEGERAVSITMLNHPELSHVPYDPEWEQQRARLTTRVKGPEHIALRQKCSWGGVKILCVGTVLDWDVSNPVMTNTARGRLRFFQFRIDEIPVDANSTLTRLRVTLQSNWMKDVKAVPMTLQNFYLPSSKKHSNPDHVSYGLLAGIGRQVCLFDVSPPSVGLRCASPRYFPRGIKSLMTFNETIPEELRTAEHPRSQFFASDLSRSFCLLKYDSNLNVFSIVATFPSIPRWVTCGVPLDRQTVVGADKYGSIFALRVDEDVALDELIQTHLPGTTTASSQLQSLMPNDPFARRHLRLKEVASFCVGDVVTCMEAVKTTNFGTSFEVLYATVSGALGALIPLSSRDDAEFFARLANCVKAEIRNLCGRDPEEYRSSYYPRVGIVDGDLCEEYARIPLVLQQRIATRMRMQVAEIKKRVSNLREVVYV